VLPNMAASADATPAGGLPRLRMPLKVRRKRSGLVLVGATRPRSASPTEVPRKTIFSAGVDLVRKSVTLCAVHADLTFGSFPAAILSWVLAQFFIGCAAYAEAMHPSFAHVRASQADVSQADVSQADASQDHASQDYASQDYPSQDHASEDADRHDPPRNAEAQRGNSGVGNSARSPSIAPDLAELSRFAIGTGGRRPQIPLASRARSSSAKSGGAGNIVRLHAMRSARPGRLGSSITQVVAAWLSRRRQVGNRAAADELGHHDRRAPREVWMARYGIE